jgi:hypothetical protein
MNMKNKNKNITLKITFILIIIIVLVLYNYYDKIPKRIDHINRNKYNIVPVGNLTRIKDNKYIDKNNVIWVKRGFLTSLLHNPFQYYAFETYDIKKHSSSEVQILKKDFDNGNQYFKPASFNYYSPLISPLSHFFADVLPIIIYLFPNYKIYH